MQLPSAIAQPDSHVGSVELDGNQMQCLMEHIPIAIALINQDWLYQVTSRRWREQFNLTDSNWMGQSSHSHIAHFEPVIQAVQGCFITGIVIDLETRSPNDGNQTWCWQISPCCTETDEIDGVILSVQVKIDSLRFLESEEQEQLETDQRRLELIVEQMPIALLEWNTEKQITEWNPAAEKIFGYQRHEAIGQPISLLIPEFIKEEIDPIVDTLIESLSHTDFISNTNENITKDGKIITCEWHNTPLVNPDGEIIGVASMATDVSDRIQTEAQLKEQEQFLRTIYDGVDCAIFVVDVTDDGDFLYNSYNRTAEEWTGRTTEQVAGLTPEARFGEVEGKVVRGAFQRCVHQGAPITEEEHLTFAQEEVWVRTTFSPLRNASGRIHRIVGTVIDITKLKQVQATLQLTLQQSEYQSRLLRTVLDATPDWIFAKDHDFRYIMVNRSFAESANSTMEEILGKTDEELGVSNEALLGNPEKGIRGYRTDDRQALAGQEVINLFEPVTLFDGSMRTFDTRKIPMRDADGQVFAVLGVSRDFTDRYAAENALRQSEQQLREKATQLEAALQELQNTQAQLVQNEKMSSLGQLVAGVAHEINNPVNFIFGNLSHAHSYIQDLLELVELYQKHYPQPVTEVLDKAEEIDVDFLVDDLPKLLNSMKVGADRIQSIVASLRTFSRMDEAEMKAVNIHDGIDSTLMILQSRIKARDDRAAIIIEKQYSDLPLVECYAGQLNQVFMNIISNAIDALEEVMQASTTTTLPHPTIIIQTHQIDSNWIEIGIKDNGPGIPAQIQHRLFDPFFTTKPVGKGTGMGLSISYKIVTEKHGGKLICQSEPGQGTEFFVRIPLHQSISTVV